VLSRAIEAFSSVCSSAPSFIVGGLAFFPARALCSVAGHVAVRCGLFIGLLVGVALIIGGLAFFPVLTLAPAAKTLATSAAAVLS
jgi:K+-transporting ATPase ATPase A chain